MLNIFDKVLLRCMKMMSYFISAKTGLSFHLSLEICEYEIKHYNLNITILFAIGKMHAADIPCNWSFQIRFSSWLNCANVSWKKKLSATRKTICFLVTRMGKKTLPKAQWTQGMNFIEFFKPINELQLLEPVVNCRTHLPSKPTRCKVGSFNRQRIVQFKIRSRIFNELYNLGQTSG